MKIPKSLAQCADLLYTTRQRRLEVQKEVEALAKQESALRDHLIENVGKDSTGVAGKVARITIVTKTKPTVADWPVFYAHIKKTGNFDLMQRRVGEAAVRERWEDGKEVPGVERFNYVDVSVNKV